MDTEKRKRFIINFVYFALILAISIVLVRYALPALVPFVIAVIVSLILKPLVNFFTEKCRINKKISATVVVILFYATIGMLVVLLSIELVQALMSVVRQLPSFYKSTVEPLLLSAGQSVDNFISSLDTEMNFSVSDNLDKIVDSLGTFITNLSTALLSTLGNTALSVPSVLLSIIITVISTVFLSMDWTVIKQFLLDQMSERTRGLIHDIFNHLGLVLRKYIVSYAIIMFITFLEIFVGLEIIGIGNALLIAALIAVFDILPIVGSGLILFPWAVITLISGDTAHGLGLLFLWAFVIVVRYIIEPKIVGNHVGLHPLLTLFTMILGAFLYGGVGILLLPVVCALCRSLNDAGIVHIYKASPPAEVKENRLSSAVSKLFSKLWGKIKELFSKIKNRPRKKK